MNEQEIKDNIIELQSEAIDLDFEALKATQKGTRLREQRNKKLEKIAELKKEYRNSMYT